MTIDEMVPDRTNPAHDPRFWCLPPVRDSPNGTPRKMYLVSQGRQVGVWHNCCEGDGQQASVGAQRRHRTMAGCVAEWQEHCLLGVHPHPANPVHAGNPPSPAPAPATTTTPSSPISTIQATPGPPRRRGRQVGPAVPSATQLGVEHVKRLRRPPGLRCLFVARYFALWGGRIVYTDRAQAKLAFLVAEAQGAMPRIVSTPEYDEAQAFSESVYWV
ncbi:hypothetical protein B0H14DRAFT_3466416 [Mycena olivaceomarginata]|nr:hypothetical protein B0H14DRAFT_3466416 [Mycena olivaceomarginata]